MEVNLYLGIHLLLQVYHWRIVVALDVILYQVMESLCDIDVRRILSFNQWS